MAARRRSFQALMAYVVVKAPMPLMMLASCVMVALDRQGREREWAFAL